MGRFFVLFFCLIFSFPALAADGLLKDQRLISGGTERSYDLFIPPAFQNKKKPLVIILQGHGARASMITGSMGKRNPYNVWLDIAQREGLAVVIPNGVKGSDGFRGWNDCREDARTNPDTDDVRFLRDLTAFLVHNYAVDPSRVYVTGTSNGGHLTIRMALEGQDLIAAAAPVVAAMPAKSQCRAGPGKVPILFINGTEDPIMPYAGGLVGKKKNARQSDRGSVFSVNDSVLWWIKHNGAESNKPEIFSFPDHDPDDDSTAVKYMYHGPVPVALIKVTGGGHTEPSLSHHYRSFYTMFVGPQNKDFEMAEEVWAFFKDKRKNP